MSATTANRTRKRPARRRHGRADFGLNRRFNGFASSPDATYACLLIDYHYEELGLDKGWTTDRVNRLCRMMEITPHELGRLCCVPYIFMTRMINANHFPPYIALHFALVESFYLSTVLGQKQKPIMPANLLYAT